MDVTTQWHILINVDEITILKTLLFHLESTDEVIYPLQKILIKISHQLSDISMGFLGLKSHHEHVSCVLARWRHSKRIIHPLG